MVLVLAIVASMISIGTAKVTQAAISSTNTNKVTLQAQQYAQSEADIVRNTNYSDLSSKSKALISGTDFYRQVSVGAESTYDSKNNIKQKICTVNVYKGTESIPRSSLKVIRLNKGETDVSSVPKGSILPWYGNLNSIPSGFSLCNGQNGTPDLRDRFLVGAGSSYSLGATGGEAKHTLTIAVMPSHNHKVIGYSEHSPGTGKAGEIGSKSDGSYFFTENTGGNQPHENRPPYYALYYIMKL